MGLTIVYKTIQLPDEFHFVDRIDLNVESAGGAGEKDYVCHGSDGEGS
ncbi:MAG: hypothetical protein HDR20_00445 [Lachnospiraceae bacterium]|nr:hypothetical protein [Lachnospiraceae bacterium]